MASDPSLADLDPDVLAFDDNDATAVEGADNPLGLSLLLQMTRFHDLGLQALLFDGRDVGEGSEGDERDDDGLDSVDEEPANEDIGDASQPPEAEKHEISAA